MGWILVLLLLINSCVSTIHHKEKLIELNSTAENEISLKLNGFYYNQYNVANKQHKEKTNDSIIKYIATLLLYDDGFLINDGGYNGISNYYCTNITKTSNNSYSNALKKYKSKLAFLCINHGKKIPRSCKYIKDDIDGKGIFKITKDSITIQYYRAEFQTKKEDSFNSYYLYELRGEIINDSSFIITKKINYRTNSTEKMNVIYNFEEDKNKPIVKNYFKK